MLPKDAIAQGATSPPAAPILSADESLKAIDAGRRYAAAHRLRLSFVIVDPGGHVVTSLRMDGAAFATMTFSEGKAFASVAAGGLSGAQLIERYKAEPWIWGNAVISADGGPMLPGAGTFAIRRGGVLIGAIASSGGGPADDDAAARAALDALSIDAP
jgi:uncharacterized protein GlcG (DUF336 family)